MNFEETDYYWSDLHAKVSNQKVKEYIHIISMSLINKKNLQAIVFFPILMKTETLVWLLPSSSSLTKCLLTGFFAKSEKRKLIHINVLI